MGMGWKIKKKPGKWIIFHGGEALVLKFWTDRLELVPRWRVATGLFLSALFAGAGFGLQQPLIGFPMLAVALVCLWALRA